MTLIHLQKNFIALYAILFWLTFITPIALAKDKGLWYFESDLPSEIQQEIVTIQIDGQHSATLKTYQKDDKSTASAPFRPAPGPHRYDLTGTSQSANPKEKPFVITGKGWLYTQAEIKRDFAALAPASPYLRMASIYKQWIPRIQKTEGKPLIPPVLHPAASAKSIADAQKRLGVKLPGSYIQHVSKPYLAHRFNENREPVSDGVFPPEDIISVLKWMGNTSADTQQGKANFARTARHFILARQGTTFLIARDDYPADNSRQEVLRLQSVSIFEESSMEGSDTYEAYPFNSTESGKISFNEFIEETVFTVLQRGLTRSGVNLLGDGIDRIRLWRLDYDERTLEMDLRYVGFDAIDDNDE